MLQDSLFQRVNEALNSIRPYLEADGGGIELKEVTAEMTALVELKGACTSCSKSHMTMKAGVEAAIKSAVPEIKTVIALSQALEEPAAL
ncbi:MAG: NifU family protein [Flavobacteriales bacterium]|nr:NifU family protein [Flavobacteriales bacterium]MDP4716957.1 NifU family protein [Flavobacteriales bacterium]MDP4731296.1 NifU family protein [Flavobacteriales bacterium]MDP4818796.1 NifU family protein [Flavobacteriales bacterium]MDP4951285.1 NifU family protein [Flavobacteriales bacterium]